MTTPLILPQALVTIAGDDWYCHTLTGAIVAWRPGRAPQPSGIVNTFSHIFRLGDATYVSESADPTRVRFIVPTPVG